MMQTKQEFLELCEAAIRAAKKSQDFSRCIDAINRLKEAPQSLVVDVLRKTYTANRFDNVLVDHENPQIRYEARNLRNLWLMCFYATGRRNKSPTPVKKPVEMKKTGDTHRDKVREVLGTSLAKVAGEVVTTEMKKRAASCDPWMVAMSVESAMFEKLGCFAGPQKAKYRSILFNMGDSKNPDLRRKVLIGEINGEKLVTMKTEEMASDMIQMEVRTIKEKARMREDNRIKIMSLIMT